MRRRDAYQFLQLEPSADGHSLSFVAAHSCAEETRIYDLAVDKGDLAEGRTTQVVMDSELISLVNKLQDTFSNLGESCGFVSECYCCS